MLGIKGKIRGGLERLYRGYLFIVGKRVGPMDHSYKEKTVRKYAEKYDCNAFLETGTYRAEMDRNVYDSFEYLATVEIQRFIYEENVEKLRGYSKLHLYNGDSSIQIPVMLDDIKKHFSGEKYKVCFWLDGHYSAGETGRGEKDTPIMEELKGIKDADIGHCVILIDDARCFIHEGEFIDYPTIPFLKQYVESLFSGCEFTVRNDIIRIIV